MKRRRRRRARKNPIGTAVTWVVGGALVGAVVGGGVAAINSTPTIPAVERGAAVTVGVVMIGGLVVALANPRAADTGLETAGIGLGALILGAIVSKIAGGSTALATT